MNSDYNNVINSDDLAAKMQIDSSNQTKLHQDRQEQLKRSSTYINSFLEELDQLSAYQSNNCPTCDNNKSELIFTKNGGEYSYCKKCRHIFLSKSLKPEHLIRFYTNYPTSSLDWHKNESEFYSRIYNCGLKMISRFKESGSILDIGCSSGFFLSLAEKHGYNGFGIEPNERESMYAESQGIKVLGKTTSEIDNNKKFDIITMWDVLEHIDSPSKFVQSLKTHLNPGGIIFIQVPTCDSLAARIMRSKSNMFDGIEHLTLFSKKSLDICFERSRFMAIDFKTIISESFALKNYLSYETDPYLPTNGNSEVSLENLINFDEIESKQLGYKIQACYTLAP